MYIILNFGMSYQFGTIDFSKLVFPAIMKVDYVRVYQRNDLLNIGVSRLLRKGQTRLIVIFGQCDPKNYPTADYIDK